MLSIKFMLTLYENFNQLKVKVTFLPTCGTSKRQTGEHSKEHHDLYEPKPQAV